MCCELRRPMLQASARTAAQAWQAAVLLETAAYFGRCYAGTASVAAAATQGASVWSARSQHLLPERLTNTQ